MASKNREFSDYFQINLDLEKISCIFVSLSHNIYPIMPNTCNWDPATNSLMVTLVPPSRPNQSTGSASIQITATPLNEQVINRCYSSYSGPPASGQGFGYSWYQAPPPGDSNSNPNWNVQGPAFGANPITFYITPTFEAPPAAWGFYTGGPSGQYTFNDPTGGGSSSITVTMVEPGGGGLSL